MGFTKATIDLFLNPSHRKFFCNKRVLTLGVLYPFLDKADLVYYSKLGIDFNVDASIFSRNLFVKYLESNSLESLDVSSYQGAEIVADLNLPISQDLHSKYDVIVDMGTLEHLFDLKVSLNNIFSLLDVEGIYYAGTVCNGWVNHGFYQFSPTFFIDFVRHNDMNLELLDLLITAPYLGLSWSYADLSCKQIDLLFGSGIKIGVIAVIKKLSNENLRHDVIQSKYQNVGTSSDFTPSSNRPPRRTIKNIASKILPVTLSRKIYDGISSLVIFCPLIPVKLRLSIAKYLSC